MPPSRKQQVVDLIAFETKCHWTAKVVAWLRSNYEKPLGRAPGNACRHESIYAALPFSRPLRR
jgi:hypothetical protein